MDALWNIVRTYQTFGLTAFVCTVFATPLAIHAARRFGVMDVPDQALKPHARPTPYLGGTAICLGWAAALVLAMVRGAVDWHILLPLVLGGVAVSIVGLVDDVREISPRLRLGLVAVIVAVVLISTGAGFRMVDSILSLAGVQAPPVLAVPASIVISVFVVLGACNSANLIDGLDGLCAGVTAVISLGFFLLAAHLATWKFSVTGDPARLALAVALLGATMGFLPLNFNPARIFMGDAGSMLLGYNCGMMIVLFAEHGIFRWVLGGLMVFALPITDTALTLFRRWRHGRPIFIGDRSHFYDQLVDRGMSVKKVVAISYGLAALYAVIGCMTIWLRTRYIFVLYVAVIGAIIWVIKAAKMIRADEPSRATSADEE